MSIPLSRLVATISDPSILLTCEALMAAIDDLRAKLAELKTTNDEMFARIDEDVAELRRKIEAGTVTVDDIAPLQAEIDRAKSHDIDRDFPAVPVEPEPTEGDDTGGTEPTP